MILGLARSKQIQMNQKCTVTDVKSICCSAHQRCRLWLLPLPALPYDWFMSPSHKPG